jgi:hypothetical protein
MATIDFLPVCSHCHQVLWGETIDVIRDKELVDKSKIMAMMNTNIYPARCPYCKEPITSIAMPTELPYYCEPLWPIKIKED